MTYKRKGTQRRSSNQQKATAMRWRRVQEEEAQQTHALSRRRPGDNAHGNVRDMQRAIWASYYHLTATNEEHFHQCCPKGEDSWCFFNRANALQLPESEKDHKKKNLYLAKIPKEKLEYLRAVYKDLANPSLLNRCLKGATQNPNESIHSRVWNKCSKAKFCGRMRLHFIAKLTALENNFGYEYSNIITHLLGRWRLLIPSPSSE